MGVSAVPRRRVESFEPVAHEAVAPSRVSGARGGALAAGLALSAQGGGVVSVSELWGGGFQNMAVQAGSALLMAGDNSGAHRIVNLAVGSSSWVVINQL